MILQVGVKAFLKNSEGKFLLLKRNTEKYPDTNGVWDIAGGRIEPGTTLIENLKREILEETGLEMTSEPKLIYAQDIIPNAEKHVVRLTYIAETAGTPILDQSENIAFEWLTLDEIRQKDNLDAYVKQLLEAKNLFS